MKIVHFGKYYAPIRGGMETHVETLAKHQSQLGHEVHIVAINGINSCEVEKGVFYRSSERCFVDDGVKVHLLGRFTNVGKLDLVRNTRKLFLSLQNPQHTVIHLHAPNPTFAFLLALNLRKMGLVVSHHSDVIGQGVLSVPFQLVESVLYRRAKLLISDSEQYIAGSKRLTQFRAKTKVLPLGIELGPFLNPSPNVKLMATEFSRKYGGPIWLCVGRLCRYKGFETAIRALVNVPGILMIVGTGALEVELKRLSQEIGVQDRVVWLGDANEDTLNAAYHSARALWFTSNARNEGFGQVQVESMACATPVINTHITHSGVDWVSLSNVSGLTIRPACVQSLVAASKELASNEQLYQRLSLGARQRAISLFDAGMMAAKSINIYQYM